MKDVLFGIYFLYGLSFYTMGLAIAMQYRSYSTFKLAHSLSLLAGFGVLHGLAEWGNIFIPFQFPYVAEDAVWKVIALQRVIEAISYFFLLLFGIKLVVDTCKKHLWLLYCPVIIFIIWLTNYVMFIPKIGTDDIYVWLNASEVWSRYLLAFPGGIITCYGLLIQTKELKIMEKDSLVSSLWIAAGAFFFFGIFGGLVVPAAPLFPATLLNVDLIYSTTGVRVEILRAAAGFLVAIYITRILAIFDLENQKRLDQSYKRQAVLLERERFSRDLHDGVLQSLFGLGISLKSCANLVDKQPEAAKNQINHLSERIGDVIKNIRGYINEINTFSDGNFESFLRKIIRELEDNHNLKVEYNNDKCIDFNKVDDEVLNQLSSIITEAFHNIIKHSQASKVTVKLRKEKDWVIVILKDNGIGFNTDEVLSCNPSFFGYSGNGISNMEARTKIINGKIKVNGRPNEGTEIIVSVPLQKNEVKDRVGIRTMSQNNRDI